MGDGVLAYFGFPRAFEDAAERAVRAAIGILAEVGGIEVPDGTRVQARIGIATGLVVVGEIIGTGTAQERTIVGETPISPRGCRRLPAPTPSSSASRRKVCSAGCSSSKRPASTS